MQFQYWVVLLSLALFVPVTTNTNVLYPNVLLILADDLGYADAGMFGSPTIATPNMDRLVLEGMKFTQFYAAPLCTPSRAAMLTGKMPIKTGIYANLSYPYDNYFRVFYPTSVGCLPRNETILPEYLKNSPGKYWTAMVGKWHLGHQSHAECLPTHRGFDFFFGLPYSHEEGWPMEPEGYLWPPIPLYEQDVIVEQPANLTSLTQRYTDKMLYYLDQLSASHQPFFIHLAYETPHVPLEVSLPFRGTSLRGTYGDAVQEMDHSIGRIMDKLDATGLSKNTLVFFGSDNGAWLHPSSGVPDFPDVNDIQPTDGGSNGMLYDGKGSTYEGGERVMAIFRCPGFIPPRTTAMNVTSMYDLVPTILEWSHVSLPDSLVGHSLLAMLNGTNMTSPSTFFHYWRESVLYAVRYSEWKCHWYTRPGFGSEPPQFHQPCLLFNLNSDPGEQIPLNNTEFSTVMNILNQEYAEMNQTWRAKSQYELQDWQVVPCCNGTVSLPKMEKLAHEGLYGMDMWTALGCVCSTANS